MENLRNFIREHWKSAAGIVYRLSFSILTFIIALLILEGLYWDSWNLEIIYFLSDLHKFFTSDAGKPIVVPILVIIGGVVGWITALEASSDKIFWVSFFLYAGDLHTSVIINPSIPAREQVNGSDLRVV